MFFEPDVPEQIEKYGIALLTDKGKFHFIAYMPGLGRIRLMCRCGSLGGPPALMKSRWFRDEVEAAERFVENPHACHKCLRAMETIRLEQERLHNFA